MSTAQLTSGAAVLLVKDVLAAAAHYQDKLGFKHDGFFGEPPSFCILDRDGCFLMLKQAENPEHVVPHWMVSDKLCNVYFWVTDADALCAEFKRRGASIDYGPCDQPYGCREFGIQDIDGYDIAFGQIVPRAVKASPRAPVWPTPQIVPRAVKASPKAPDWPTPQIVPRAVKASPRAPDWPTPQS